MKSFYTILLLFYLLVLPSFSQVTFLEHSISGGDNYMDGMNNVLNIDLDGDEDIDIIASSTDDGQLSWFENDGDENFKLHAINVGNQLYPSTIAVGDINNDEYPDIVVGGYQLLYFENDGEENFEWVTISWGIEPNSVHIVDLDGDEDNDILATADGIIFWFENDLNGSEADFIQHTVIDTLQWGQVVNSADVNGDGDMDIIASDFYGDTFDWYENDGDENFTRHTIISDVSDPFIILGADIDNDENMDIITISFGNLSWHENDGDEGFITHTILTNINFINSLAITDLDSDNDLDLVIGAGHGYNSVLWFSQDDEDHSFDRDTIAVDINGPVSLSASDIDEDNDIDVFSANLNDNTLIRFVNDGDENFTPIPVFENEGPNAANSVYAIDMDNDDDLDVLSASQSDFGVTWYENDGEENFTLHSISTDARLADVVYAIDVNEDGEMDALSASWDKLSWYENDGEENFSTHVVDSGEHFFSSVFAFDLDSDGDVDILSSNRAFAIENQITWYRNDGDENFTKDTISTDVDNPNCVFAIDVNGDENIDVLSTSSSDSTIAWYENDGDENFTQHILAKQQSANSVYAIDVDSDEDIDIISSSNRTITWFENIGDSAFVEHVVYDEAWSSRSVFAEDVDGDNDIDIVSASWGALYWYENIEDTVFTPHTITENIQGLQGSRALYVADVNGDLSPDLLAAISNEDEIVWFENSTIINSAKLGNNIIPGQFALDQNYPNPFNPKTTIRFNLERQSDIKLVLYDIMGREVATLLDEVKESGYHSIDVNGSNLASGVYFYRLTTSSGFDKTKRMLLIK